MNSIKTFDDGQMIKTIEELDSVSLDVFKDTPALVNLLVVKDYVYAIASGIHICNGKLSEINDIYSLELKAYEFIYNYCFFFLGLIKTNKDFVLSLYRNSVFDCSNVELDEITINDVGSNIQCEIMVNSNKKELICFYQNDNKNEIVAKSFNINIQDESNAYIEDITSLMATKGNSGAKVIKSISSQDGKKSLVCYINDYNNCDCLIYDITSHTMSDYSTYFDGCLSGLSSLNIEYFENSDGNGEYILYCFQSETKLELVTFDSNFISKTDNINGIYDLNEKASSCRNFYVSNLVHNSNNFLSS